MFKNTAVSMWGASQPDAAHHEVMASFINTLVPAVRTMTLLDADLAGSAERCVQGTPYESQAPGLFAINERLYGQCEGAEYRIEIPKTLSLGVGLSSSVMSELEERVYCMKLT